MGGVDAVGVAALIVSAAVSALVVEAVRRRATRIGLMDTPNARSTHRIPTPRGGGVGILAGLAAGVVVASLATGRWPGGDVATLVACTLVVATLGFVDDLGSLPPSFRLLVQLSMSAVVVLVVGPVRALPLPEPLSVAMGPVWLSAAFTALWITAVTNFFNFMDGVDGLAGGQALVSAVAIGLVGWSSGAAFLAIALAGASAGFLVHNWPPARIFMGDVGSGAVGFLLAGLPLLAEPHRRGDAVLAVGLGLTFFILDPLLTLGRRALARRPLMQAHREHLYQRLIPAGTFGTRTTTLLLAGAAVLALAGGASFRRPGLAWLAVGGAVALFLVECVLAFRASAVPRGIAVVIPAVGPSPEEMERNGKPSR